MKGSRNLWISVVFVAALVAGSLAAFATGTKPVLGLDLEGGVSVVLAAPQDTPPAVMQQALENIRGRIDAFGVGEPQLFLSGTNIEVQLPGLARGAIDVRPKDQYCLIGAGRQSFGCFPVQSDAANTLSGAKVSAIVRQVCLTGLGDNPPCFGTQAFADSAVKGLSVVAQSASPSASSPTPAPSSSPAPAPTVGPGAQAFCIQGSALANPICTYETEADATAALKAVGTNPTNEYCIQDSSGTTLASDTAAACAPTQAEADAALSGILATHFVQQFCAVSSAGIDQGCFLTRDAASAKLQATGQERLLQVIGTTARLEQRQVLATITPGSADYQATPVTCQDSTVPGCGFDALKSKPVVFLGRDGTTKYKLGPVLVTGDAIKKATAVYDAGGQSSLPTGWQIDFQLTSSGSGTFSDVTTRLVGQQLAIVVDNVVISAPTIKSAITNGSGVISGSFTEVRAKDLATQLNAGALPVNLIKQQVVTVSPTLGKESLHQGLVAGIVGLVALFAYLLFYYRLLGVVAWAGMTIWAVLAFALVSFAGRAVGYSLSLAGIAGLVISLGVTADSYIVFFERLKDEVRHGKTPRSAVQPAFKRAYKTIVAADIVTGLAAIVLYITAISSVRGFALTLGVATVLDLFVVYFFKRPVVFLIARNERLVSLRGFGLASGVAADPVPVAGGSK